MSTRSDNLSEIDLPSTMEPFFAFSFLLHGFPCPLPLTLDGFPFFLYTPYRALTTSSSRLMRRSPLLPPLLLRSLALALALALVLVLVLALVLALAPTRRVPSLVLALVPALTPAPALALVARRFVYFEDIPSFRCLAYAIVPRPTTPLLPCFSFYFLSFPFRLAGCQLLSLLNGLTLVKLNHRCAVYSDVGSQYTLKNGPCSVIHS